MLRATSPLLCALFFSLAACDGGPARTREPDGGGLGDASSTASDDARAADAGAPADATTPDGSTADGGGDPSDALFQPDHVLEVRITLAASDWAALRAQRPELGPSGMRCSGEVGTEPYTQFHAELSVDGVTLHDVAVRKKGNLGSLSSERPGLKLDVHEFVPDQDLYGLEHLTLNNNRQDPSLIHQCLGYGLFRAAGLPASRCSFAHVVVNGEDLGIYTHVETPKKELLRRHFADATGELYESGGDFDPGRVAGFQPKSDTTPPDCRPLEAVAAALTAPDDELETALGAVLDVPQFMRYWAMEVLTDHWDGYANNQNNAYLYADPSSGRVTFLPWGIDSLFAGRARSTRPASVFACGALAFRLYAVPSTRRAYLATLRDLLDTVWNEPRILAEIDRMEALLAPYGAPATAAELAEQIDDVRGFVETRAATLRAELDAGEPVWPYARSESCRPRVGSLAASFRTTWGSLDRFDAGTATMSGSVGSVTLGGSSAFSSAGDGDDGQPVIRLFELLPDGRYAAVYVSFGARSAYATGTRSIDLANVAAVFSVYDPATDTASTPELIFPGTLRLDSAAQSAGGEVSGSVSGDVLEI